MRGHNEVLRLYYRLSCGGQDHQPPQAVIGRGEATASHRLSGSSDGR